MASSINVASAYTKLLDIANLISKGECTSIKQMKSLIRELTNVINSLTNGEKIQFIKMFNTCFTSYYNTFPEAMELYFTQIITIIKQIQIRLGHRQSRCGFPIWRRCSCQV